MKYADVADVEAGFRPLDAEEQKLCDDLLDEAGIVIDAYNQDADEERKRLVSCRMVRRQLDAGPGADQNAVTFPMGASQGSASALGYQQSWTMCSTSPSWKRSCWALATGSVPAALWRT